MQNKSLRRLLSGILAAAVAVNGLIVATPADNASSGSLSLKKVSNSSVSAGLPIKNVYTGTEETSPYANDDVVRVSIVLKDKSTIEAGFEVKDIAENDAAMNYREGLRVKQEAVALKIEKVTKKDLDVVWNLTLAANLISANVKYGDIEKIEELPEVEEVLIETQYEPMVLKQPIATDPNMATSSKQIGSTVAWADGYTGAGSRIAIIDTGVDTEHQSFDGGAFMYSLEELAEESDDPDFIENLNLLTAEEVDGVKDKLNIGGKDRSGEAPLDAEKAYISEKIPFGYSYIDKDYDVNHENDKQGEHGSHVSGISTANKYIPGDNGYVKALDNVMVQGVAPDAQLLTMKVFGEKGGANDSDYMAAIEDAIILKADSVNLSLGSGNAGTSRNSDAKYQAILDSLTESGVVVAMSAGNSGAWADESTNGDLYADGVNFQTDGSPGSYTNSLTVASIDNDGMTANYFTVNGQKILYTEPSFSNKPFTTLADKGELEYVFIDGFGTEEDWAAIGDELVGKVAVCQRGDISFYQKGDFAVEAGAIAIVLYNNQAGTINMDLSDYSYEAPFVSITQEQGALMKAAATAVEAEAQSEEEILPEGENTPPQEDEETAPAEEDAVSDENVNEEAEEANEDESASEDAEAAPEETGEASEEETEDVQEESAEEETEAAQEESADEDEEDAEADEAYVYYVGSMTVAKAPTVVEYDSEYYTMSDFSSWGVPGSLELKPEITAPGGNIYSVNGYHTEDGETYLGGHDAYENMSGTSMASPQIAGMAAVAAQYVREKKLEEKTGLNARILIQSLLMSTADPVVAGKDAYGDKLYYSVMKQGAGLANIGAVINADSYILMGEDATLSNAYADGKVKAELGDDPYRRGLYTFSFSINNLTDKAKTYRLSADMFTQAIDDDYLYQETTNLGVDATFDKGKNVEVPANGSVTVNVTLELDAASLKMLRSSYENGAYIEGFVYAKSAADEEGNAGTVHSIPVLGYFGSWTEPSMFDLGSYIEYEIAGTEERDPYLAAAYYDPDNAKFANAIIVTDADSGDQFRFGGNPYFYEDYMPERDAINGSDPIAVSFAAVRNAADSLFEFGINNGYANMSRGPVTAAYYYTNGGSWQATGYSFDPGLTYGMYGARDGDAVYALFGLAPEYYVDDESGKVDWRKVGGSGAFKYVDMIVDNEAPEATTYEIDEAKNVLKITASDNHYIAAVALYNSSGAILYDATGSKANIAEGEEAVYELSLDDVTYNKGFYIQVYDYAMNTATYFLDEEIGELDLPEMIAFNCEGFMGLTVPSWVELDKESTMTDMLYSYAPSMGNMYFAATIYDHIVFASDNNGVLYAMPEYDLTNVTKVGDLVAVDEDMSIPVTLTDMAYSSYYDYMFGVGMGYLFIVDPYTAESVPIAVMPFSTNTLACDDEGNFYCNEYGTSDVYRLTMGRNGLVPELIARVDIPNTAYVQAMEVNPNTGMICWTSYSNAGAYYVEIDPRGYDFNGDLTANFEDAQALLDYRTGVIDAIVNEEDADFDDSGLIDTYDAYLYFKQMNGEVYNDLYFELTSLIIPELHEDGKCETTMFAPLDWVLSVELSQNSLGLIEGGTKQLEALVKPWNASNSSVVWSSDDETVAKVNQNGVVTAVSVGKCTITAASVLDSSVYAECDVTVKKLASTITGVLVDENYETSTFEWNLETDDTWTSKLPLDTFGSGITSATLDPNGYIYVMDDIEDVWGMHKINAATGEEVSEAPGLGLLPYWDMAYSTVASTASAPMISGIYGYWFLPNKDPMSIDGKGFNWGSNLAQRGANYFVGLASMGPEDVYDEEDDEVYETERYVAIDDAGGVWILNAFDMDGDTYAFNPYYAGKCGINEKFEGFGDDMYCSLVAGTDGNLYFSVFDKRAATNKIYFIDVNETADSISFNAALVGNVGEDVYPAVLLTAKPNSPAANASVTAPEAAVFTTGSEAKIHNKLFKEKAELVEVEAIAADEEPAKIVLEPVDEDVVLASSNRHFGASESEGEDKSETEVVIEEGAESFELDITAKDKDMNEKASTNGLFIVSYDPEVVTLEDVISNAEYNSNNINTETGIVVLGYVNSSEAIPAGEVIDTLLFTVNDPENFEGTVVNVAVAEVGNGFAEDENGDVVGEHDNILQESGNGDITPADIVDDRDVLDEVLEDLPNADIDVVVDSGEEPDPVDPTPVDPTPVDPTPDEPVVTTPGSGNFVPYDPGSSITPSTTEADNTTAPAESNEPAGEDPASTTADSSSDPASSDSASSDLAGNEPAGNDPSGNEVSTGTDAPNSGNGNTGNAGDVNAPNDEDKNQYTGVALFVAPAAISALAVLVTKKHRR